MKLLCLTIIAKVLIIFLATAQAFCGFYVSQADTDLFNDSSKVIIARDGNRTVLTMANDFVGDVQEFAMVIPVPTIMEEGQIQIGSPTIVDRIDAYSAPRLVEYHDSNPCGDTVYMMFDIAPSDIELTAEQRLAISEKALGVTVEASFDVGEYEILILSAQESDGLETWLIESGYNIPEGAAEVFNSYIEMDMKFFVAKVNVERFESSGNVFLRPLMMTMETDELMLPIQLGTVNARGPQDLIVFLMSPDGRIEVSNYPTLEIPSDLNLPEYIEEDFGQFYTGMFNHSYERLGEKSVFLEYAWDMSWCDPCAADPLSQQELLDAGVFWLNNDTNFNTPNIYLTRLHLRYTKDTHPEDLKFEVTNNRRNFQGRYILQRPFLGEIECFKEEIGYGYGYVNDVQRRQSREALNLAGVTGWNLSEILSKIPRFDSKIKLMEWEE